MSIHGRRTLTEKREGSIYTRTYINTRAARDRERRETRIRERSREKGRGSERRSLGTLGWGRALDGRLDRSNRSRPGREPGAREPGVSERASETEKEIEREGARAREREKQRARRRGGLRSPGSYSGTVALTTRIHACAYAHADDGTRATFKELRAPVSSVTLATVSPLFPLPPPLSLPPPLLLTTITTTLACFAESSALFLSSSLSHPFSLRPHPRGPSDTRARQHVNGSARCHRRETSFRGSRGGRPRSRHSIARTRASPFRDRRRFVVSRFVSPARCAPCAFVFAGTLFGSSVAACHRPARDKGAEEERKHQERR